MVVLGLSGVREQRQVRFQETSVFGVSCKIQAHTPTLKHNPQVWWRSSSLYSHCQAGIHLVRGIRILGFCFTRTHRSYSSQAASTIRTQVLSTHPPVDALLPHTTPNRQCGRRPQNVFRRQNRYPEQNEVRSLPVKKVYGTSALVKVSTSVLRPFVKFR